MNIVDIVTSCEATPLVNAFNNDENQTYDPSLGEYQMIIIPEMGKTLPTIKEKLKQKVHRNFTKTRNSNMRKTSLDKDSQGKNGLIKN